MKGLMRFISITIVLLALVGGVVLVSRNQETRRGATANETSSQIFPDTVKADVGSSFFETVVIITGNAADKLQGAEFNVIYDKTKLRLNQAEGLNGYTLLNDPTQSTLTTGAAFKMITLGWEGSGAVAVTRLSFTLLSSASGMVTVQDAKIQIKGQATTWSVTTNSPANFSTNGGISPTTTLSPTPTYAMGACVERPNCLDSTGEVPPCVIPTPAGGWCPRSTSTPVPTATILPSATPTVKPTATSTPVLTSTPTIMPTSTPTRMPTATPTQIQENGVNGILRFKTTFMGVTSGAQCAGWPVKVMVMDKNGVSKTYENVAMVDAGQVAGGLEVYQGEVQLVGMTEKNNLAVFIKGPRQIQMKYGKDGQGEFYNQAGGEISVTTSASSTTNYNFTGYPMMAGDVNQDGVVDGRDFSEVKVQANMRGEGENPADLNGNCKMESQDVAMLMLTLRQKQEQLY